MEEALLNGQIGMPGFSLLADEDLFSIIAFLRSDDPWVQTAYVNDKDSQYSFLVKVLACSCLCPLTLALSREGRGNPCPRCRLTG